MIDEEEIKHLQKLSKNDLARFISKQNENELNGLREEIKRLREEIEKLKADNIINPFNLCTVLGSVDSKL